VRPAGQTRAVWLALVGVPVLFAAITLLQMRVDAKAPTVEQQEEELLLRSPSAIKKMSLGYDALLADVYWTRVVQYYGTRVGTPEATFELLWPLLDITTTLDPKLVVAYRFGAIFLSEPGIAGAGRSDLAVRLVKRGIAANPDNWRLNSDLGFLYYWRLKDYPDSAAAYLEGSKNPQAPPWLKMMAARVSEKGGSLETSAILWSELRDSTQDPAVRERANQMLRGLKAQEDLAQLDQLAERYQKRFARYPASTLDLREAGLLSGVPVDPDGFPYVFGPDGGAALHPRSTVVIPREPRNPPSPIH
jgi:hypothetical protein